MTVTYWRICLALWLTPVHNVGKEIVVPKPVLCVHLFIVHRQGSVQDTPLLQRESRPASMLRDQVVYLHTPRLGEPGTRGQRRRESFLRPNGPL